MFDSVKEKVTHVAAVSDRGARLSRIEIENIDKLLCHWQVLQLANDGTCSPEERRTRER